MIAIISPAKNMKVRNEKQKNLTAPVFFEKTEQIYEELKTLKPWEIESLMKVNEKIALQAFLDIQDFKNGPGSAAILTYDGLVFQNIKAADFNGWDMKYARKHVRILSGMYGVLKPADAIHPYRLEMGCRFKPAGQSLYQFWGDEIYKELYREQDVILNLASEEYAKTVRKYLDGPDRFVDVEFLTMRGGKLRTIVAWAKMARGQMVRHIVKNRIDRPEDIKEFDWDGYAYEPSLSTESKYVFIRRDLKV
ncbi:peroxide stress protein YaaA [Anaerostipes sp.]|uniref:peroxide stress protein YaaA n=1 Tax=Anaerostipes sp. TaxID=1872530 RepID=UPI0025C143BC|nr:peroxide stress protein YaaA [Anaerostipes sp.]MBS7006780.1 peroxide stress protein YaaA [Anaerostipes sp.]